MKLANILILMVVLLLPLLVHEAHGKGKNRWGCVRNSECLQPCRRSCLNVLRPLCYNNQCFCRVQLMGYPRSDFQRMGAVNEDDPGDVLYDFDLKQTS